MSNKTDDPQDIAHARGAGADDFKQGSICSPPLLWGPGMRKAYFEGYRSAAGPVGGEVVEMLRARANRSFANWHKAREHADLKHEDISNRSEHRRLDVLKAIYDYDRTIHIAVLTLAMTSAAAEAALSDIGDATREEGDDIAWAEKRAAAALPELRAALADFRVRL